MKKLQRFGIVSLAALTLGTLTLSNEQFVKAEENTPTETTVSHSEPVEEVESFRDDEGVEDSATLPDEASEMTEEEAYLYQPASSAPTTPTEHKSVLVLANHYLITPDGLHRITGGAAMLDSRDPDRISVTPEPKAFANLDFVGARKSDDKLTNSPFTLGKTLSLADGLSSNTTVDFYYKPEELELSHTSDYARLPKAESNGNSVQFTLNFVDEAGRDIAVPERMRGGYYTLIPGVDLAFATPDIPGYRAKQESVLATYEALKRRPSEGEYVASRNLRFQYEKVDDSLVPDLDVAIIHVQLGDAENDFKVLEEEKHTVKSGSTLTLHAKEVAGYKPVTKTLSLDYDSLSRGHIFGRAYQFYYTKDGQVPEWLKKESEEPRWDWQLAVWVPNYYNKLTINHIFDDGVSEPRKEVQILPLKPDGSVAVPAFKTVDGWEPDRARSRQRSVELPRVPYFLKGSSTNEPFSEHVAYRYENLFSAHVFDLYYTKVEAKPSEPVDNNGTSDTGNATETKTPLVVDEATGLTVLFAQSDADVVTGLRVSHVETKATTTPPVLVGKDFDLFDVEPVDKDGNVVDITSPATVSLPVDAGKQVTKVLYLPSPDKEESLAFETKELNGKTYAIFTVNHFSQYAIVYLSEEVTDTATDKTDTKPADTTDKVDNSEEPSKSNDNDSKEEQTSEDKGISSQSPEKTSNNVTDKIIGLGVDASELLVTSHSDKSASTREQMMVAERQTPSRVDSRHLPKTSDSKTLLATLGMTILAALCLVKRKRRI